MEYINCKENRDRKSIFSFKKMNLKLIHFIVSIKLVHIHATSGIYLT